MAVYDFEAWQVDFMATYLNSPTCHTVYIELPEGFVCPGDEDMVGRLNC